MKNKLLRLSALSLVFAVIISIFGINAFADSTYKQYVYDQAYLLTDSQYAELNAMAAEISEKYRCSVHFVTTDDPAVNVDNIQTYSEDLYLEYSEFGYGSGKDGVMLVLGTYDRCYHLLAYGQNGNNTFTDYCKDWMSENFVDNFSYNDWYGGFYDYITDCEYALEQAAYGAPVDVYYETTNIGAEAAYVFALAPGLGIALIMCTVFKSQMKTAKAATTALSYVDKNGIDITNRQQRFRFSTVSRTEISSSHSSHPSHSSRGGTSVSSRGFSGKSGRF